MFPVAIYLVISLVTLRNPSTSALDPKFELEAGNSVYFGDPDNILRNRNDAMKYCVDEGGELAKITDRRIFIRIRRNPMITMGSYWIDGKQGHSLESFQLEKNCTTTSWNLLSPPLNMREFGGSCLAFVKGRSAASTQIKQEDCSKKLRVMCSFPNDGCNAQGNTEQGGNGSDSNTTTSTPIICNTPPVTTVLPSTTGSAGGNATSQSVPPTQVTTNSTNATTVKSVMPSG